MLFTCFWCWPMSHFTASNRSCMRALCCTLVVAKLRRPEIIHVTMCYTTSPYLVDFEVARSFQEPESLPVVLAVFDRRASIKQPEVTQGVQLPARLPTRPSR